MKKRFKVIRSTHGASKPLHWLKWPSFHLVPCYIGLIISSSQVHSVSALLIRTKVKHDAPGAILLNPGGHLTERLGKDGPHIKISVHST